MWHTEGGTKFNACLPIQRRVDCLNATRGPARIVQYRRWISCYDVVKVTIRWRVKQGKGIGVSYNDHVKPTHISMEVLYTVSPRGIRRLEILDEKVAAVAGVWVLLAINSSVVSQVQLTWPLCNLILCMYYCKSTILPAHAA
jgi:hypothetical protein